MTLKEYLSFIRDEDVRIELELDVENEKDYSYFSFWLSDFRSGIRYGGIRYRNPCSLDYAKWTVESISFIPIMDDYADFLIQIKP